MCKNWKEKGICRYGDKCLFAHDVTQLNSYIEAKNEQTKKEEEEPIINVTSKESEITK